MVFHINDPATTFIYVPWSQQLQMRCITFCHQLLLKPKKSAFLHKISDKCEAVLVHFGLVPHAYHAWLHRALRACMQARVCVYLLGATQRKCYEEGDEYNLLGHSTTFPYRLRNNAYFETSEAQV